MSLQDLAQAAGLDAAVGAMVTEVVAGSPAARAGVETDDVILAIDGDPVRNATDVTTRIGLSGVGSTVAIRLHRDGTDRTLNVVLDAFPE